MRTLPPNIGSFESTENFRSNYTNSCIEASRRRKRPCYHMKISIMTVGKCKMTYLKVHVVLLWRHYTDVTSKPCKIRDDFAVVTPNCPRCTQMHCLYCLRPRCGRLCSMELWQSSLSLPPSHWSRDSALSSGTAGYQAGNNLLSGTYLDGSSNW